MFFLFDILGWLLWPGIIIAIIVAIFRRRKKRASADALTRDDMLSQGFLVLGVVLLAILFLVANRDYFSSELSWRLILFAATVLGFAVAYFYRAEVALLFSIFAAIGWWFAQGYEWMGSEDIRTGAASAGFGAIIVLLYLLGYLHEGALRRRFRQIYTVLGLVMAGGYLFFLSTRSGIELYGEMTRGLAVWASWQLTGALAALIVAAVGLVGYIAMRRLVSVWELGTVGILLAVFILPAFIGEQVMWYSTGMYGWGSEQFAAAGLFWAIIFNAMIFFYLVGIIFSGYSREEAWRINVGVFGFFVLIIVKYFDWFFDSLDKSIFFIGAGVLLLGVGWALERSRRVMLQRMHAEPSASAPEAQTPLP